MKPKQPVLTGPRVRLRMATSRDAAAILDYFQRNRQYLAPTDPAKPAAFYTKTFWLKRLKIYQADFREDRALRLFLFLKNDPRRVVGAVNLTQIQRGPLQACYLGYSLDEAEQGKGLMTEALRLAIPYVFQTLNLHRIMANYLPTNTRSGNLLRRLGFVVEGYARDYLRIAGAWRDHISTGLVNPDWKEIS